MAVQLKEGLSTGSTATAAAMAALRMLITGQAPREVLTPLPPFSARGNPTDWRALPVAVCGQGCAPNLSRHTERSQAAYAGVVKDGGDDPDVTNGALICATVFPAGRTGGDGIAIAGGPGVGRVTRPGLPIAPGNAAINPVPRRQITAGVQHTLQAMRALGHECGSAWNIIISVPDGEKIAARTMNGRLGIVGGISILGTHGVVRPYSHAAWRASLKLELEAASAQGSPTVCLATGRRSVRLLHGLYPALPEYAFIQAADLAGAALRMAGRLNFDHIVWGCFFGKLLKLASGLTNTHAAHGEIDLTALARMCIAQEPALGVAICKANTANEALDLILGSAHSASLLAEILQKARQMACKYARRPVDIHLFHLDGRELARI